jgi:peroxiredoxin
LSNKSVLVAIAAVAFVGVYFASHRSISPSRAGNISTENQHQLAPSFSITDLNGHTIRLADLRGKVVLLDFWATWCAPCREEIPRFVAWQNQFRDQGLQVVGVSMDDDQAAVRRFDQEFGINYPVAIGNAKLADAYGGILGLPVTFLIGRDGQISAKYTGMAELAALEREIKAELQKR